MRKSPFFVGLLLLGILFQGCSSNGEWIPQDHSVLLPEFEMPGYQSRIASFQVEPDNARFWLVEVNGRVLNSLQGGDWKRAEGLNKYLIQDLFLAKGGKKWALTSTGILLYSSGQDKWREVQRYSDYILRSIWGNFEGTELWMAGIEADENRGVILHVKEGGEWEEAEIPLSKSLRTLHGDMQSSKIWALEEMGTILYSADGQNWDRLSHLTPKNLQYFFPGPRGDTLWALSSEEQFYFSTLQSDWQEIEYPQFFEDGYPLDIFVTPTGTLISAGEMGIITYKAPGKEWQDAGLRTANDLYFLAGAADMGVWALGSSGGIFYSPNGENWKSLSVEKESYSEIVGTRKGDTLWTVGSGSTIIRSQDGSKWEEVYMGAANEGLDKIFCAFDAPGGVELWAGGRSGTLIHSKGGEYWREYPKPFQGEARTSINGIVGATDGSRVWIQCSGAIFTRSREGEWEQIYTLPFEYNFVDMYCTPDGAQLWAVVQDYYGEGEYLLYFEDGKSLQERVLIGSEYNIRTIQGTDDGKKLWLAGNDLQGQGLILLKEAGKDLEVILPHFFKEISTNFTIPNTRLIDLFVTPDGEEVWMMGAAGIFYSKGGIDWAWLPDSRTLRMNSIYVSPSQARLWATTLRRGIISGETIARYPVVEKAQITYSSVSNPTLSIQFAAPDSVLENHLNDFDDLSVTLEGIEDFDRKRGNKWVSLEDLQRKSGSNELIWTGSFPEEMLDLSRKRTNKDKFFLRVKISDGTTYQLVNLKRKADQYTFVYNPTSIIEELGTSFYAIVLAAILLLGQIVWLIVSPLTFLKQAHKIDAAIEVFPNEVKWLATLLKVLIPVSFFAYHPRSLGAWVKANGPKLKTRFDQESTVKAREGYVALPVRLKHPYEGRLLEKPDPAEIGKLFQADRTLIQIVGKGGSGKTTLALQIGRWAYDLDNKDAFGGVQRIPVLIESETSNLAQLVRQKLTACLGKDPGDKLVMALLAQQRLLIIVDALSERTPETQKHLADIHGVSSEVNALIISTRDRDFRFEAGESQKFYPEPLNQEIVLSYFLNLLRDTDDNPFKAPTDQLDFANKIIHLFQHKGEYLPVTPLLVKITVDYVLNVYRTSEGEISPKQLLAEIPLSIPDVYNQYLRQTNPNSPGLENALGDEQLLRAANCLGELSLGKELIPSDFPVRKAEEELARLFPNLIQQGINPLARAEANGIVLRNDGGGVAMLRFNFDPLAEFTGAFAKAEALGADVIRWEAFTKSLHHARFERAQGFKSAFELVYYAYRNQMKWPDLAMNYILTHGESPDGPSSSLAPSQLVQEGKELIGEGETEQALQLIFENLATANTAIYNTFSLIKANFAKLQREIEQGVISPTDASVERNKLHQQLLNLLDSLD